MCVCTFASVCMPKCVRECVFLCVQFENYLVKSPF